MKYVFTIFIIIFIFFIGFELGLTVAQRQYVSKTLEGIQSAATSTIEWPIKSSIKIISSPFRLLHKIGNEMNVGFERYINAQKI
ncbi:MAG: hypothetical protein K8S27_01515 [Candidatus Omnitrophica bacterium]|nr:hypothetical protein [Candidatus Omnitrophota bacterium]